MRLWIGSNQTSIVIDDMIGTSVLAALPMIGDEFVGVGDREGAMACLRLMAKHDDDHLGCRMAS